MKLEVGQRVRLKNGEEHSVTVNDDSRTSNTYPFAIDDSAYTADGFFHRNRQPSQYDVVKILSPAPKPAPTRFKVGKWYPCRNSRLEAKILEMGLPGPYTMTGVYRSVDDRDRWGASTWSNEGRAFMEDESATDILLPEPPKPKVYTVTRWVNFYIDGREAHDGGMWETREGADLAAEHTDRTACKKITLQFTEGEGL